MNYFLWRTELKNASRDIVWIMFAAMVWSWATSDVGGLYFTRYREGFMLHLLRAIFNGLLLGTICLPIIMIFGASVQHKRNARLALLATLPIEPVAASLHRYIPIIIIQSTFFLSLFSVSRAIGNGLGRSGFAFLNYTFLQIFTMQIVSIAVIVLYFFLSHLMPKARFAIYWMCSFITVSGFLTYSRYMQGSKLGLGIEAARVSIGLHCFFAPAIGSRNLLVHEEQELCVWKASFKIDSLANFASLSSSKLRRKVQEHSYMRGVYAF